ncbi:MAG: branched-chain amino acid ABC transporter permease [Armatimonadota bacterium]|nr:branched-chain amino acid ABC transporter permease [Armatimonadota bacterium]
MLLLLGQAAVTGLLTGAVYALVAVGLTLIFGVMRVVNFAHGALLMLGMYAAYWFHVLLGVNPYLSLPVTFILLFALGAVIQRGLLQPILAAPQHNQLLLTLGVMLIIENLALFLWSPDFRTLRIGWLEGAIPLGALLLNKPRLIAFAGALVLTAALYLFLTFTELGRAIRATAQDRTGASLVGVNVTRINTLTFGLGAACAGVAGALITPYLYTAPQVGHVFLLYGFVVVVLGGLGSFTGALAGGLLIGIGESLGAALLPGSLKELVVYLIFILVLLFRPTGLFGVPHRG